MMKKGLWTIGILIVILLIAPYFMGRMAEKTLLQTVDRINHSVLGTRVHLTVLAYDRGWFHSDVKVRAVIHDPVLRAYYQRLLPTATDDSLVDTVTVWHGPIIFDRQMMTPFALAFLKGEGLKAVALTYRLSVSYVGHLHLDWTIPAFHYHNIYGSGFWQGAHGDYYYNPRAEVLQGQETLKALQGMTAQATFHSSDITRTFSFHQVPSQLWVGQATLSVPSVVWKTSDVAHTFSLSNLRLNFDSHIDQAHFNAEVVTQFDAASFAGHTFGPLHYHAYVNQLNVEALANMTNLVIGAAQLQSDERQAMLLPLLGIIPTVLNNQSAVGIKTFTLQSPDGLFAADARVTWPQFTPIEGYPGLLTQLEMEGHLQVPVAWVQHLLTTLLNQEKSFNAMSNSIAYQPNQTMNTAPTYAEKLRDRLQDAVTKGYIQIDHGCYVTALHYAHNHLSLNHHLINMNYFIEDAAHDYNGAARSSTHSTSENTSHGSTLHGH